MATTNTDIEIFLDFAEGETVLTGRYEQRWMTVEEFDRYLRQAKHDLPRGAYNKHFLKIRAGGDEYPLRHDLRQEDPSSITEIVTQRFRDLRNWEPIPQFREFRDKALLEMSELQARMVS